MTIVMLDLFKLQPAFASHSCDLESDNDCVIGEGPDSDGDQLSDEHETTILGTNPNASDTDGDGLSDLLELILFGSCCPADPTNPDTDGDGLTDGEEFFTYGTGVTSSDTDGDGLNDGAEVNTYNTNPLDSDSDNDDLDDFREVINVGSDPNNHDTDGDNVPDGRDPDPLDMFVVPESPIGSIAIVLSSLAALLGFVGIQTYRKRRL